jgi:hypothetical protein
MYNALWRPPLNFSSAPAHFFLPLVQFQVESSQRSVVCACRSLQHQYREREKYLFFFGKQTREKLFEFLKGGGVIFVYPIEHRICGLSLVIAIFFFFLSAWDTCAPITVWCVCLCVTSWDYLDWSTSFSFFSGGFVVYLYKIEEGRRAFDSIQTQQVNERRRRLVLFYFHIEKVISFFCFFCYSRKKKSFFFVGETRQTWANQKPIREDDVTMAKM